MKVLVINAGSSSLKYQLFDMNGEKVIAKGNCEKIGQQNSFVSYKANGMEKVVDTYMPTHNEAITNVLNLLTDKEIGVLKSLNEIDAFGHRILHGGELFQDSVVVDDDALDKMESLKPLGPLHMPANIAGIRACMSAVPGKPQIAVFDTAFHQTMPNYAYMYGVPYELYKDYKVRKYGFHGTSHKYVAGELAKEMGRPISELKLITIHLGNGSSMCAVKNGKSIDTTMGFTPLEGLLMGTRCGDIDASVVGFISEKLNMTASEVVTYLNKKSGILGLNGVSGDMRENNAELAKGNKNAKLAIDMLSYRIKKYVGAFAAAMGGVDGIVFTGGIGEHQEDVREYSMSGLEFLGIEFDKDKNYHLGHGTVEELSLPTSKVKIYRIPTNEELVIARDCVRLCK